MRVAVYETALCTMSGCERGGLLSRSDYDMACVVFRDQQPATGGSVSCQYFLQSKRNARDWFVEFITNSLLYKSKAGYGMNIAHND